MVKGKKYIRCIPIIVLFALTFLAYVNSFSNEFVWDDSFYVERNQNIRNFKNLPEIFAKNLGYGAKSKNNFYRPIQELTLVVDYSLYKLAPWGYHLTNTLLHFFCALLVFFLIKKLFGNLRYAYITGILFAIHPIQTEAVTYIAGRADSLYVLFFLLSIITYMAYLDNRNKHFYLLTSLIAFILALLSKEMAFLLPLYLLTYHLIFKRKESLKKLMPYLIILGVYALARITFLKFGYDLPETIEMHTPLILRLLTFLKSIYTYLFLLFIPVGLHMERDISIAKSILDIDVILAIAGIVLMGFFIYKNRDKEKAASFGGLWFLMGLLPVSNIYPINAFISEHWVYLSSIGFFLFISVYVDKFLVYAKAHEKRNLLNGIRIALSLVALTYLFITIDRNRDWRDEPTLYNNILKYNPTSSRVRFNLGRYHEDKGDIEKALKIYKETIRIDSLYISAYINMANIYIKNKSFPEALKILKKARTIEPDNPRVLAMTGVTYVQLGYLDEGINVLKKVLDIDKENVTNLVNLGDAYFKKGDYKQAEYYMRLAYEKEPTNITNLNNLGSLYGTIGNKALAATFWQKSLGLNPNQKLIKLYLESVTEK